MRFKVDENLHPDVAEWLRQHGHDATTVYEENMRGHADQQIAEVCRREVRVLITLDLDFADLRVYPPKEYPGIIVLRVTNQSRPAILKILRRILGALSQEPLAGHLWIVDEIQIRIRQG